MRTGFVLSLVLIIVVISVGINIALINEITLMLLAFDLMIATLVVKHVLVLAQEVKS